MRIMSWLWRGSWLRPHRWRWWGWVLFFIAVVLIVRVGLLPRLLRHEIVAALSSSTSAIVRLADVDVNLLRGRLILADLSLTLPGEEQPVITADELHGDIRLLAFLQGETVIKEVRFSGVRVSVERAVDGQFNLTRLLPPPPPDPVAETDLPTLTVERLRLEEVGIEFRDLTRTPGMAMALSLYDLTIGPISLQAKGLATPVQVQTKGQLNAKGLRAGSFASEGRAFWSRSETAIDATIDMQQFALAFVEPYLRETLSLQKLAGQADARIRYRVQRGGEQPPVHALSGALTLTDASFIEPSSGQRALQVEGGQVEVAHIDLLNRDIRLASVVLREPRVLLLQTPDGLNWAMLTSPRENVAPADEQAGGASPAWRFTLQSLKANGGEIVYRESAWLETEKITVVPEEMELRELRDGTTESLLRFLVRIGDGRLSSEGKVQFSPLRAHVQTELAAVELSSFAPALHRMLLLKRVEGKLSGSVRTELTLTDGAPVVHLNGALDTSAFLVERAPAPENVMAWESGHLELREGSTLTPLKLDAAVQFSRVLLQRLPQGDVSMEEARGNVQLSQHQSATETSASQPATTLDDAPAPSVIDAQGTIEGKGLLLSQGPEQQELLSCHGVKTQLKAGSRLLPFDLRLAEVVVEYPYAQAFRTEGGVFQVAKPASVVAEAQSAPANVEEVAPIPAEPAKQADLPAPSVPFLIHIDRVSLIGGQFYFEDYAVTPSQTIYWQDVRVNLGGVAYPFARPATFTLHAFNMDGAPIEVQGSTQRRGGQLETQIDGTINRLTLSRLNAYLAPQLGYRVRRGAVSVKWSLLMPGDLVHAHAAVTVHDLGLGGKESTVGLEEQVGLSMSLIVALLKDLNGNINLQLPVEGRLNEPGFRFGGTVWRAIRDVLIGAVTSPLKLLGAIFSDKDNKDNLEDFSLDPIPFVPGTSLPSDIGRERLRRLKLFLAQRPELALQLSSAPGSADQQALQDRLILSHLQNAARTSPELATADAEREGEAWKVPPEAEVQQFLTHSVNREGGKPLILSEEATILLTALRTKMAIEPQTLAQLTQERVQAVITTLMENSGVAAVRLRLSPEKPRGKGEAEVQYMIQAQEGR